MKYTQYWPLSAVEGGTGSKFLFSLVLRLYSKVSFGKAWRGRRRTVS
jgi:hypothetical protein